VDNLVTSALDDDDAWRDKYTGGALGRYIETGLGESPPDGVGPPEVVPPDDDAELAKYRAHSTVPPWLREGDAP
jgi:hypothetical protein